VTTFVLVHGAWHGAWCWGEVPARLASAGHRTVAVDLPCDDPHAGWTAYADTVMSSLAGVDDELVVVGHSLGGGVIPLVAAQRPVEELVFLCSFPPMVGRSLDDSVQAEPELTEPRARAWRECRDAQDRYVWPDFDSAAYSMYHDCSEEDARWAFAQLRPQGAAPFAERWPLEAWPDVPVTFITCLDDRMGSSSALRRVARERFGVEPIEIRGSHSPFVSQPGALTEALLREHRSSSDVQDSDATPIATETH
jgi:pimeloyl-ACP methyl ester carboxylesterase